MNYFSICLLTYRCTFPSFLYRLFPPPPICALSWYLTYFSICSLSCSRAKNWVSFLISLMAPFSSFLYLCFIFPFSFSSFDAVFFFFLSSNLSNKNQYFKWSFQNRALFIWIKILICIMLHVPYFYQTETYTSSILGSNIFRGLGFLCGILTCFRDLLLLSFMVFWRSFIDSCKSEKLHKVHSCF